MARKMTQGDKVFLVVTVIFVILGLVGVTLIGNIFALTEPDSSTEVLDMKLSKCELVKDCTEIDCTNICQQYVECYYTTLDDGRDVACIVDKTLDTSDVNYEGLPENNPSGSEGGEGEVNATQ